MPGMAKADQFRTQPLAELAQQLRYAPRARRSEQLPRAERLHDEIDPSINYPFDYIAYRITRYRQPAGETLLLVGEAVQPDLRLIIDLLSQLQPPGVDDTPTVLPEALAARFGVSTRTLHRWRKLGLRWRWVSPDQTSQPRIGFTEQAVAAFVARHGQRVAKAGQFDHLSDHERQRILRRATRLAAVTDASMHQVAVHLAKRTGRGSETIRQMLVAYEKSRPNQPLFPDRTAPLTPKQHRVIARAFQRGIPVGRIARRFQRHRATIYRAIQQRRAADAQRIALDYIASPTFERDDADDVLLRPGVEAEALQNARPPATGSDSQLPSAVQALYQQPAMRDEDQRSLLLRYNYLKFKAARIRSGLDRAQPRAGELDRFEACIAHARQVRTLLVRVNLPTVLSVARRHLVDVPDPGGDRLLHLLSVGHRVLSEAIETYDPARSQAFGANLANRLMRRFANDPMRTDQPPTKAHRRRSGEQALAWLIDDAQQAGLHLPAGASERA